MRATLRPSGLAKYRSAAPNGQATAGLVLASINTSLAGLYHIPWTLAFVIGFAEGL